MKKYSMPFGRTLGYIHPAPERTARKQGLGLNFDITFQVWPNRASMAKSIRMQQGRMVKPDDWKAVIPLNETEGF